MNNYFTINLFALLFTIVTSVSSCAPKIPFKTSSVVPAAEGHIKVTKDKNDNYAIQVEIIRLAAPSRLTPSKNVYVIWMLTDNNMAKNLGQISNENGVLNKKLKGSFKTVSSFKPTKIFISAEDDPAVSYPGMNLILTTESF